MLTADRFPEFFEALHGRPPFPWQARLAATVIEHGRWPDVLDLPTGVGKTSALDVALYMTAVDPLHFPRRIVQVVDRRVVVDQGAEHARRVLAAIHGSTHGILAEVEHSLRRAWNGDPDAPPFTVAVMRGAMPRDDAWTRRPDQPVIALSTVDQVGSRLLFRGYGVSTRMAPVHAGLLGNDTLFLLDEVHLAVPFTETLLAIRDRWRGTGTRSLPDRWGVVRMSATPGAVSVGEHVLRLDGEDRATPALAQRLGAHKLAELRIVRGRGKAVTAKLARQCLEATFSHLDGGAQAVAVVVNRVNTACQIRHLLESGKRDVDAVLLTGRMRPLDRDRVLDGRLRARIGAGRNRSSESRPIVVVATQCIEVGADFDFDALVTECAALDALLQRVGRLDRLGELGESRATIIVREDQTGEDEDPVYGRALARTWEWLSEQGAEVDLGIDHLAKPPERELAPLLAPVVHAPVLLPAHLDAWVQTSPKPVPDPEPSLWLHGPERGSPDVQVIWRADLSTSLLAAAAEDRDALDDIRRQLVAFAPGALESVSVPIGAVRAWLAQGEVVEVSDVVGASEVAAATDEGRHAVRWRGDASDVVSAEDVTPGDTLLVPSSYGGLRFENWAPEHRDPVVDLGDLVQWRQRARPAVRLHPLVLAAWLPSDVVDAAPTVPPADAVDRNAVEEIEQWLRTLPREVESPWNEVAANLRPYRRIELTGGRWGLVARSRVYPAQDGVPVGDEDDTSFIARQVTLASHCRRVKETALAYARSVGLPDKLAEDLALAGWLHDVGKADPRFQRMLAGGSEVRAALIGEPLAKSPLVLRDLRSRRIARERSGLPTGHRHELVSVGLLQANEEALAGANDPDLILFLIGSHHGWGRPFAPPVDDPNPVEVVVTHGELQLCASSDHRLARLDSGLADRFWSLVNRYGWWGLAWLEAVFQLADHRVSAEEEVSR